MKSNFSALVTHASLLRESKSHILSLWLQKSETSAIINRIGTEAHPFPDSFAGLMFDFFIDLAEGKKNPDESHILGDMVAFFYSRDIAAQDLFLLFTGMKDAVTEFLFTCRLPVDTVDEPALRQELFKKSAAILNNHFASLFFDYTLRLLQRQEELGRYSKLIEEHVIVSRTDLKGMINYVSDSFCDISGYSREELMGKPHNIVRHRDMPKEIFKDMWETIQNGKIWDGKIKNCKKNEDYFIAHTTVMPSFDNSGEIDGYVSIRHDITDKVNADIDTLTRAYTRRRFESELNELYLKSVSGGSSLSLIVMDVDNFKMINDTYGHLKGDEVLTKISEVTKQNIRKNDLFARWGGEEFVILMGGALLPAAVQKANQIRKEIKRSVVEGVESVTCSFGVAQLEKGETREEFIKRADTFLYKAKKSGKNRVISV